jgi:hypothetical protein
MGDNPGSICNQAGGTDAGTNSRQLTPVKKIWRINARAITFAAVLYFILIKKGRGIWPVEALATNNVN